MLHLSFSDFGSVLQLAAPELPNCPKQTILDMAALVFSTFTEETQCFREHIDFDVKAGVSEYDLISPHDNTVICGILQVVVGEHLVMVGDYISNAPSRIEFTQGQEGRCRATVVLKTSPVATTAPSDFLALYADIIAGGVKSRLMMNTNMPWANIGMVAHYKQQFEDDCLRIGGDVRNQFSVTRKSRAPQGRPIWRP